MDKVCHPPPTKTRDEGPWRLKELLKLSVGIARHLLNVFVVCWENLGTILIQCGALALRSLTCAFTYSERNRACPNRVTPRNIYRIIVDLAIH